jgi:hypothetical protein
MEEILKVLEEMRKVPAQVPETKDAVSTKGQPPLQIAKHPGIMACLKNIPYELDARGKDEIWLGEDNPQRFEQDRIGDFKTTTIDGWPGWKFLYNGSGEEAEVEGVDVVFPYPDFDHEKCGSLARAATSGDLWYLKYGRVRRNRSAYGFRNHPSVIPSAQGEGKVSNQPTEDKSNLNATLRKTVSIAWLWQERAIELQDTLNLTSPDPGIGKSRDNWRWATLFLILLIVNMALGAWMAYMIYSAHHPSPSPISAIFSRTVKDRVR